MYNMSIIGNNILVMCLCLFAFFSLFFNLNHQRGNDNTCSTHYQYIHYYKLTSIDLIELQLMRECDAGAMQGGVVVAQHDGVHEQCQLCDRIRLGSCFVQQTIVLDFLGARQATTAPFHRKVQQHVLCAAHVVDGGSSEPIVARDLVASCWRACCVRTWQCGTGRRHIGPLPHTIAARRAACRRFLLCVAFFARIYS